MKKLIFLATAVVVIVAMNQAAFGQNYTGVTTCRSCHNGGTGGSQYTEWIQTLHSQAYDSVLSVQNQMLCAPCHTTGWDTTLANHGADDYVADNGDGTFTVTNTSSFNAKKNVQCEDCHGPVQLGSTAPANHPSTGPTPGSLQHPQAEVCGACHTGDRYPYYDEWKNTSHALSDTNESPSLQTMFRSDPNCSACHTYQGFMQFVNDTAIAPDIAAPPGDAALPIVCVVCHDPHSNANDKQLRITKDQLCQKCHQPQYDPSQPVPGTAVHNTEAYMFEGIGGYEFAGYTYESSMHKDVVPNKCVTCHMVTSPYVDSLHIAQTGHTFMPNGKACAGCHADFDTLLASFDYRRVQTVTDSLATELSNRLAAASPADSATDAFKRAKFNYDFVEEDMSHGIHNTKYAQGLLLSALENFSPESVIEPVNSGIPTTYTLGQNYPNPFNPTTSISFALPARQFVRLQVFNVLGDIVTTLVNQEMPAGTYRVTWSGRSLNGAVVPSGVYLYKLDAGTFSATRKMTMMK